MVKRESGREFQLVAGLAGGRALSGRAIVLRSVEGFQVFPCLGNRGCRLVGSGKCLWKGDMKSGYRGTRCREVVL